MTSSPAPAPRKRRRLARILRDPRIEIALGIMMFAIGLIEVIEETFLVVYPSPDLHHFFLIFGGITSLRGMIDVIEGAEHVAEAESHLHHHPHAHPAAAPVVQPPAGPQS
jgi:hypothetical protein